MANSTFPQIREFQSAHRKLLREYISAVDAASGLPFFVNLTNLLIPYEKEDSFLKLNRQSWFLFAPFTWRPFVRLLIETHIKAKMGELIIAYNQLALRLPEGKKFDPFRAALKSAVMECNQLSDTLTTWKNGRTLVASAVPVVLGWVTSWLGTDNLLLALPQFGIEISGNFFSGNSAHFLFSALLWILSATTLLLILLNSAFECKRGIFLPTYILERVEVSGYNIYASEDALFKLIGRYKTRELALDAMVLIFFISIVSFALFLWLYYFFSMTTLNLIRLLLTVLCISILLWGANVTRRRWN